MKNTNYNLIKLLHNALDDAWRIENHYMQDAKGASCNCGKILKEMSSNLEKSIDSLKNEVAEHHKSDGLA